MLKIIYDETGDNVDNKDVQWYVDQKLEDYFFSPIDDMTIMVSNIAVINQFAKYVEEFIPVFDVEFYWHDIKLDWDTYLAARGASHATHININQPEAITESIAIMNDTDFERQLCFIIHHTCH